MPKICSGKEKLEWDKVQCLIEDAFTDCDTEIIIVSFDEEESLKQIDALKEELTHMYRYKSSNHKDRFDLAPGCENILGDDRVYTLALLALDLFDLRREHIVNKKRPRSDTNLVSQLTIRPARRLSSFD